MKRYHPVLVILHWVLAVMICLGLVMGGNVLSATPNASPEKLFYLKMHMSAGIIIFVLIIFRLFVRLITVKPPHADIGNNLLNRLGVATHYLFYLVIILMCGSGIGISIMAELPDIVFGGSGVPLPEDFSQYPPRKAHGFFSLLLIVLIIGHIGAFFYHQFIRKDGLFSRMWFGNRD